ncbi:MAG: type I-C CRISPR-associated endonuclease Cas1 [Spirochaetales bacterium]|nr:type I-C CRISPR-associated endonuclease Cas1 [Spirochaetales bacterium]
MKRHLNTLFITTEGTYLYKDGQTIAVKIDKKVKLRIPIHTIGSVVCFGKIFCSPQMLGFCAANGVSVSFLSTYGRFLARIVGPVAGNVLLRKEQYRLSDDKSASGKIAKSIVIGKLINSRSVISRAIRDHYDKINIKLAKESMDSLLSLIKLAEDEKDLDTLRGYEGDGAKVYFHFFNELITAQKSDFIFKTRNRRPPLDRVNSLLSFIYTLLLNDVRSALETVGLDPQVGFLHRDRPGRHGLALDIIEEFRPFFADRLVLSLINLKQVNKKGFKILANGAVYMNEDTRKQILTTYQKRKQDVLIHPLTKEKTTIGLLFFIQAQLMARFIRKDLDGYPPFIWK